jgi:hypothetical protein
MRRLKNQLPKRTVEITTALNNKPPVSEILELFFQACYRNNMILNKFQTVSQIWWTAHNIG